MIEYQESNQGSKHSLACYCHRLASTSQSHTYYREGCRHYSGCARCEAVKPICKIYGIRHGDFYKYYERYIEPSHFYSLTCERYEH